MPIEVELKARVRDRPALLARLRRMAPGRPSLYRDVYYDRPDRSLDRAGRQELRLRTVESAEGHRYLLTFKGRMLDPTSSPEYETEVAHLPAADAILSALGFEHVIAYVKRCVSFTFASAGRTVTATVVEVPALDHEAFIEVETLIDDPDERPAARAVVRDVLAGLGLADTDLEPTFYVDLVSSRRATAGAAPPS